MSDGNPIDGVVAELRQRLDDLPPELAHRQTFLGIYLRTTQAVGEAIKRARFEDPAWVELWDVKFAQLYLQAHDAEREPPDSARKMVGKDWVGRIGVAAIMSGSTASWLSVSGPRTTSWPRPVRGVWSIRC
jgi:hypothetical protein